MKTRTLYIFLAISAYLCTILIQHFDHSVESGPEFIIGVVIFGVFVISMIPTLIANKRNHNNAKAIFWANLLLGWTFIGWAVAFIWAMTNQSVGGGAVIGGAGATSPELSPNAKWLLVAGFALASFGFFFSAFNNKAGGSNDKPVIMLTDASLPGPA